MAFFSLLTRFAIAIASAAAVASSRREAEMDLTVQGVHITNQTVTATQTR
ncbi:hypothetical protein O5286_28225 [Escherichia coli]|nr:hypothetical protein [Escherichia coli]